MSHGPAATRVLFVADQTALQPRSRDERHPGGAELTDAAAMAACPHRLEFRRATELRAPELDRFDLIVVSNAIWAPPALLDAIARTGRHVLFEHHLRLCEWHGDFLAARDWVHRLTLRCACRGERWRRLFDNALGVLFLTEALRAAYHDNPHYRGARREEVLGASLFSAEVLERCRRLLARHETRSHSAYAWSANPIKGHQVALDHCRREGWAVREIRNRAHHEVLDLMAASERFVYLPVGLEPAGRMPVEARLTGCEVVVNANVGVSHELLWSMPAERAWSWLEDGPSRFWRLVDDIVAGVGASPQRPVVGRGRAAGWDLLTVRRRLELAGHWLSAPAAARAGARSIVPPWRA